MGQVWVISFIEIEAAETFRSIHVSSRENEEDFLKVPSEKTVSNACTEVGNHSDDIWHHCISVRSSVISYTCAAAYGVITCIQEAANAGFACVCLKP